MIIMYYFLAIILILGLCYYIARNFYELANFINYTEKLTKQEKKGMSFLKSKKCLYSFLLINAVILGVNFFVFTGIQYFILYSLVTTFLVSCFYMDFSVKLLPDVFTISILWLALIGSALNLTNMQASESIIAASVLYLVFFGVSTVGEAIAKKQALGGGDIKIMAAFGALFGMQNSLLILILSCVIMIAFVALIKIFKVDYDKELPFGIALTTSALISLFSSNLFFMGLWI